MDGAGGGGNSGCDVVAAVFGLASGVCSVFTLLLPLPYDRAPQVRRPSLFLLLLLLLLLLMMMTMMMMMMMMMMMLMLNAAFGLGRNIPVTRAAHSGAAVVVTRLLLRVAVGRSSCSTAREHVLERDRVHHLAPSRQVPRAAPRRMMHTIAQLAPIAPAKF